jgi:hypothetical protein
MTPFDFINEILVGKKQMIHDEGTEGEYVPFIVNRGLSYYKDCIMSVNEMNRRHFIDKKMQNDFYLNIIRSYKRPFAKWVKNVKDDDIQCIKSFFGFSEKKALEVLRILSTDQIKQIKEKTEKGGT